MKKLKKYIKEELTKLQEKEYKVPSEIVDVLKNKLKMDPLVRYIDNLKALNSIPPSYRIFLLNGNYFDIYYEEYSLMAKIEKKEYYLSDLDERNHAKKHINRLMVEPILKTGNDEAEDTAETPPSPPSPPSPPLLR